MKTVYVHAVTLILLATALFTMAIMPQPGATMQSDEPDPPEQVVKLIFIHHSTGENWLADGYGELGRTLALNNYFVSDTNYGWGPDGIGDRTDIPDWLEWFAGDESPRFLATLYNEGDQHSDYTRPIPDPGGENQIVMFKSCFPNSALYGNPEDPPTQGYDLTVGNAKYVYNTILQTFAAHPNKLFIVITAPPLSDPEYADNARAFNQWLVHDWLEENDYTLNNVAVFDFYNILTSADAHHRFNQGQIEHLVGSSNTLAYPSGDDHPSAAGSRKATDEFIPLLNAFYQRWQENAPPIPQTDPTAAPIVEPEHDETSQPSVGSDLIADFESPHPTGTDGWQPFWEEAGSTTMDCASDPELAHQGAHSLRIEFEVAPGAWATCALLYDAPQNWSDGQGLTFFLQSSSPGIAFNVDLYAGENEAQETYAFRVVSPEDSASAWTPISISWSSFQRVDWEENAGAPFTDPEQVRGMAFGFDAEAGSPDAGTIWVDDLALLSSHPTQAPLPEAELPDGSEREESPRGFLPCGNALALPMAVVGMSLWKRRKRS